eukprot:352312-Chlamydomonas_euryale.AAC.25
MHASRTQHAYTLAAQSALAPAAHSMHARNPHTEPLADHPHLHRRMPWERPWQVLFDLSKPRRAVAPPAQRRSLRGAAARAAARAVAALDAAVAAAACAHLVAAFAIRIHPAGAATLAAAVAVAVATATLR